MRGAVLQLHRWGLLPAVAGAGTRPVRSTTFHLADAVTTITVKPRHGVEALYAPDVRFGATTVTGLRWNRAGRATGITGLGHWCWLQGVFRGRVGRWALCVPPC
jgi:hypothetical protein